MSQEHAPDAIQNDPIEHLPISRPVLLALLVVATAIGPLAMQMILPGLPEIQAQFAVSAGLTQLLISVSLIAIALSNLVFGPLSDRYGRLPVLLIGLIGFVIGSAIAALAPTIEIAILGRVIQAVGGSAGMVLSRAIVRDLFDREHAASMIAYITMAMVVAPMLAPAIGGVLIDAASWRAVFVFTGVAGFLVLAAIAWALPETNHDRAPMPGPMSIVSGFGDLLKIPAFRGYAMQSAFTMVIFFAFISGAPYLTVSVFGYTATDYGLFFMSVAGSYMAGNFLAARISPRVGVDRMILIGSAIALVGVTAGALTKLGGAWNIVVLFAPAAMVAFSNGLSLPNSMAGAVSVDPKRAGAASGLMGFIQMTLSAAAAQFVGETMNGSPWPMFSIMLVAASLALLVTLLYLRPTFSRSAAQQ